MESLHNLNIEGFKGVTSWLDEVNTGMHSVVNNVHPVDLVLSVKVGIESGVDIVNNWPPGLIVVHEVSKTRGINNGQTEANAVLLDIG